MKKYLLLVISLVIYKSAFAQAPQFVIEDMGFPSAFNIPWGDINDSTHFTGRHATLGGYVWKDNLIIIKYYGIS